MITLKPFQLEGFNKTKDSKADIILWSTGCGKSVFGCVKAKHLLDTNQVDKIFIICRNHNKTNWKNQFQSIVGLDATVAEAKGTAVSQRKARRAIYRDKMIVILNYEKLRLGRLGDVNELKAELKGKRAYFIFDEMPVILKTLNTQVYKGTRSILKSCLTYKSMLSATPLENSPEDIYACCKLLDPTIFTNVTDFRKEYGLFWSVFNPYKIAVWDANKLKTLYTRLDPIIHKADKYNQPEIAAQFPKESWEDVVIDLSDEDRRLYDDVLYDLLTSDSNDILSKILVLQLICDNPLLLQRSNAKLAQDVSAKFALTDKHSAKLSKLKDMLGEIDGKIVLFNMYSELGSDSLYSYITKWGYKAVLYDGSPSERQLAEDQFRKDSKVKIFVSSDKGSDSINLEQGSSVINYNLPYKYTTLLQRVNRINRITSTHQNIYYYNLLVNNSVEDRKLEIITKKKNLQDLIFGGSSLQIDDSMDLNYLLTGIKTEYLHSQF